MLVRRERWRVHKQFDSWNQSKTQSKTQTANYIIKIKISTLFQIGFGFTNRSKIVTGCFNLLFCRMRC
jgi:hypothetical protein